MLVNIEVFAAYYSIMKTSRRKVGLKLGSLCAMNSTILKEATLLGGYDWRLGIHPRSQTYFHDTRNEESGEEGGCQR